MRSGNYIWTLYIKHTEQGDALVPVIQRELLCCHTRRSYNLKISHWNGNFVFTWQRQILKIAVRKIHQTCNIQSFRLTCSTGMFASASKTQGWKSALPISPSEESQRLWDTFSNYGAAQRDTSKRRARRIVNKTAQTNLLPRIERQRARLRQKGREKECFTKRKRKRSIPEGHVCVSVNKKESKYTLVLCY